MEEQTLKGQNTDSWVALAMQYLLSAIKII